jgi:hypothetical protein
MGLNHNPTREGNQPHRYAQLKALPWRDVPIAYDARERTHGRNEWRTLKVAAVARPELWTDTHAK